MVCKPPGEFGHIQSRTKIWTGSRQIWELTLPVKSGKFFSVSVGLGIKKDWPRGPPRLIACPIDLRNAGVIRRGCVLKGFWGNAPKKKRGCCEKMRDFMFMKKEVINCEAPAERDVSESGPRFLAVQSEIFACILRVAAKHQVEVLVIYRSFKQQRLPNCKRYPTNLKYRLPCPTLFRSQDSHYHQECPRRSHTSHSLRLMLSCPP